jgi:signal transduction histidine kinase
VNKRQAKLDSLTTMAMGMAHDFNNCLASISGNAKLLEKQPDDPSLVTECAGQINESADRALHLTRQLMLYTGRAPLQPEPLDLSALVRAASADLAAAATDENELRCELAEPLPLVRGDAAQLVQLVRHLVANAAEAMIDEPGIITVSTAAVERTAEQLRRLAPANRLAAGTYVGVAVTDRGPGIPRHARRRLFEPFFSTKLRAKGMGLPVVLGILRAHGGAVEVQTRRGRGSTFRALFPAAG